MAQTTSATPVKVSSAATSYTPATLDPDLRSQINTLLLRDGHVTKIQDSLLHALNAHPSNWPTTVRSHALTLLRSGEINTFPALLRRVLADVHAAETPSAAPSFSISYPPSASSTSPSPSSIAAKTAINMASKTPNLDVSNANGSIGSKALALPQSVIDEALRITRESLGAVCEIDEATRS